MDLKLRLKHRSSLSNKQSSKVFLIRCFSDRRDLEEGYILKREMLSAEKDSNKTEFHTMLEERD